jgi:hypothetical protein
MGIRMSAILAQRLKWTSRVINFHVSIIFFNLNLSKNVTIARNLLPGQHLLFQKPAPSFGSLVTFQITSGRGPTTEFEKEVALFKGIS